MCAACGGDCCFTRPGLEAPDRFLAAPDPASALAAALDEALRDGRELFAERVTTTATIPPAKR